MIQLLLSFLAGLMCAEAAFTGQWIFVIVWVVFLIILLLAHHKKETT